MKSGQASKSQKIASRRRDRPSFTKRILEFLNMTEEKILLSEDRDNIRLLTLNRPDKLNAMNEALIHNLVAAVDTAHADDGIAAVIMTGGARAFSAGADIKEAATRKSDSPEAARRRAESHRSIYQLAARTDKPVIAAVQGYVLGGGCNLAIASDMVVAGENAIFGYPEVKRGLAATMVTPGLVHRIGPKAAFEMLTLAENISAEKALSFGLINRIVADANVIEEAVVMAQALAAFDQRAIRTTKRVFLKSTELSLEQSLDAAAEAMLQLRALG
jgi:enoyl-CoA hydratase/carnithine racemase